MVIVKAKVRACLDTNYYIRRASQHKIFVTPQVVDKFVFYRFKLTQRHPERSEGSQELGTNLIN
jgi:hypothetical protein